MVPMLLDLSKVCFALLILKDNLKIGNRTLQLVSFYEVFLWCILGVGGGRPYRAFGRSENPVVIKRA